MNPEAIDDTIAALKAQLLNKAHWNSVKDAAQNLLSNANLEEKHFKLIQSSIEILQILQKAAENSSISCSSPSWNDYYTLVQTSVDQILLPILRGLTQSSQKWKLPTSTQTVIDIAELSMDIITKNIEKADFPKLIEALPIVFTLAKIIETEDQSQDKKDATDHQNTIDEDEYFERRFPFGREFKRNEERIAWEGTLKEGMIIDCLKLAWKESRKIWSKAKIIKITKGDNGDFLQLSYLEDFIPNVQFKTTSYYIDKENTRAVDFEWRQKLDKGSVVDAAYHTQFWSKSVVVDTRLDEKHNRKLLIRFRTAKLEAPTAESENNQTQIEYFQPPDEWISPFSVRIQTPDSQSSEEYYPRDIISSSQRVDDGNDQLFTKENAQQQIFAIERPTRSGSSSFIVKILNEFGERNGFAGILNRFKNISAVQNNICCPIDILQNYLHALSSISDLLFKPFAEQYTQLIFESAENLLLDCDDMNNLRKYEKESIQSIVESLESLLGRSKLSEKERIIHIDQLSLKLSLKCSNTQLLKQRIVGLKLITSIIEYSYRNGQKSALHAEIKPKQLAAWILAEKIIENIYITNIHSELITRSQIFLKFSVQQNILQESTIQEIFLTMARQDEVTQQAFLKLLTGVCSYLSNDSAKAIVASISRINDPREIRIEHIELVYELAKSISLAVPSDKPIALDQGENKENIANVLEAGNEMEVNSKLNLALEVLYEMITQAVREGVETKAKECFIGLVKENQNLREKFLRKLLEAFENEMDMSTTKRILPVIKAIIECQGKLEQSVKEHDIVRIILENMRKAQRALTSGQSNNNSHESQQSVQTLDFYEKVEFLRWLDGKGISGSMLSSMSMLQELWALLQSADESTMNLLYLWMEEVSTDMNVSVSVSKFLIDTLNSVENKKTKLVNFTNVAFHTLKTVVLHTNTLDQVIEYRVSPFIQRSNSTNKPEIKINNQNEKLMHGTTTGSSANTEENHHDEDKWLVNQDWRVQINPWEIKGYQLLWDIANLCKDAEVSRNALMFIASLHLQLSPNMNLSTTIEHFLNESLQKIKASSYPLVAIEGIHCILSLSETQGVGYLKSLHSLVKRETVNLSILPDLTSFYDVQRRFDVKISSNKTLLDLKLLIAGKLKCTWNQVRIKRTAGIEQLSDIDNGRTINELRLKNYEDLYIEKAQTQEVPEAAILTFEGDLTVQAEEIFTGWFRQFSTSNKMNAKQLGQFFFSCTHQQCGPEDSRVTSIIQAWDADKDGKLELDDFLRFYIDASKNKKHVVWKNIRAHGFGNDLRPLSSNVPQIVDINALPRSIVMRMPELYDLLFSLLDTDNNTTSQEAMKLLNRLPASPELVKKILSLQGVKGVSNPDWNGILCTDNSFKLLYTLTIVEYLMEDQEADENKAHLQQQQDDMNEVQKEITKIQESKARVDLLKELYSQGAEIDPSNWREQFVEYGGFDQLFQVFTRFSMSKEYAGASQRTKAILAFILRIMSNYLTAIIASKVPFVYEMNQYAVQSKLSLETIDEHLKSFENPEESKKIKDYQTSLLQSDTQKSKSDTKIPEPAEITDASQQKPQAQEAPPIVGQFSKIDTSLWGKRNRVKVPGEFIALKEKLSGYLGDRILQTLDMESMVNRVGDMLFGVVTRENADKLLETEDKLIVEFGWSILVDVAVLEVSRREQLTKNQDFFQKLVLSGLFHQNFAVRRIFSHSLYIISRSDRSAFSRELVDLLIKSAPRSTQNKQNSNNNNNNRNAAEIDNKKIVLEDDDGNSSNQFYELLVRLLDGVCELSPYQLQSVCEDTIALVKSHISKETRSDTQTDRTLLGLLNLLNSLISKLPTYPSSLGEFMGYLLDTCLYSTQPLKVLSENLDYQELAKTQKFQLNPLEYVKCKSQDSRRAAYNTLITILKTNLNYRKQANDQKDSQRKSSIDGEITTEEKKNQEGIDDTVKIPSLLQQFFTNSLIPVLDSLLALQNDINFNTSSTLNMSSSDSKPTSISTDTPPASSSKYLFHVPSTWYFRPQSEQKTRENYLGIRNLSQICYMNSMLQQLFMTQTFRYALLASDDHLPVNLQGTKKNNNELIVDDNLLHQLQRMFAFLELSDRQDFDPSGFCFAYKDHTGQPVNVCVQQDAQEFINFLFEKLENSLKQTPFKYILQSIFGGHTCSKMICSACGHVKSKHELFYTLQLRVEGNNKLEDSLKKFIEGETISDFKCDECKQKCDQARHTKFSSLPNVLIIQLQRIVMDFDTFMNKKINNRFEFPDKIDLREFTQKEEEGVQKNGDSEEDDKDVSANDNNNDDDDGYYKYKLKGITVHSGTADVGHYYSYINVKDEKWVEFNDSLIKDFDPRKIETECFGGNTNAEQTENNYAASDNDNFWEKGSSSKNAYILVYEREAKTPLSLLVTTPEMKEQASKSLHLPLDVTIPNPNLPEERIAQIDYYGITKCIPEKQFVSSWLDNHKFMAEKHVYSLEFLRFIREVWAMIEKPADWVPPVTTMSMIYPGRLSESQEMLYGSCLDACSTLFFDFFYRACDYEIMQELVVQIRMAVDLVPSRAFEFAKRFIFDRFEQIECIFTICPEAKVRAAFQQVIAHTINNLLIHHGINSLEDNEESSPDNKLTVVQQTVKVAINNFLSKMIAILHTEVAKNWQKMHQYLEFWRDFAYGGEVQVAWCFKNEMIARLVDFFLGAASPLTCFTKKKLEIRNRFIATPFSPLIQTVSFLLSKAKLTNGQAKVFTLSPNDLSMIESTEFHQRLVTEKSYDVHSTGMMCQMLSYQNKMFSENFGRILLEAISKSNSDKINYYFDILQFFLNINDELFQQRIEWTLGYPNLKINSADGYESKPSLDEDIVTYETKFKVEGVHCVLHLLLATRKTQENMCLHILFRILTLCKNDVRFLNYLMELPAPNISCSHYLSWVRPHLETMLANAMKNFMNQTKEELTKQTLALYTEIEDIVNKYADQRDQDKKGKSSEASLSEDKPTDAVEEAKEETINGQSPQENSNKEEQKQNKDKLEEKKDEQKQKGLRSLWPNYLIGKTQSVEEVMVMPIGEDQYENGVILRELEYTVLYAESKPTGSTNDIFPSEVKAGPTILLNKLNPFESNIHQFFFDSTAHHTHNQAMGEATNGIADPQRAQENHGDIKVINLFKQQVEKEENPNIQTRKNGINSDGKARPNPLLINIQRTASQVNDNQAANQSNLGDDADNSENSIDSNKAHAGDDNSSSSNINSSASFVDTVNPQQSIIPSEASAYRDTDFEAKKLTDAEIASMAIKSDSLLEGKNDQEKAEEISKNSKIIDENDLPNPSNSGQQLSNQAPQIPMPPPQNPLEIPISPTMLHPVSPIPLDDSNPNLGQSNGQIADQNLKVTVKLEESVGPVVRRYVIDNSSESIVRVVINFSSEVNQSAGSPFNQCMPLSVSAEIQPNSSHAIFSMKKVNPNRVWDKFTISAECFFLPSAKSQQPSGTQSQQKEGNSAQKSNPKQADTDKVIPAELPSGNDQKQNSISDPTTETFIDPQYYGNLDSVKVCSVCTLENPSHRQFCEVCESKL